jgi:hypothetical protein
LTGRIVGLLLLCIPLLATACGGSASGTVTPDAPAATATVPTEANPTVPASAGTGTARAASPNTATGATIPATSAAATIPPTAPSATIAPRATPAPSGALATPARAGTAIPAGGGAIPAGWQTYKGGARVPFTIAYPPDWTVDDSRATQGRVYIYGPGVTQPYEDGLWLLIATTGNAVPGANIDVLRDQYFATEIKDPHPEAGIDVTRRNEFSGLPFASLGTTFNAGKTLCYAYIGLAVRDGVPWRFRLNSPYADYTANLESAFAPMVGSLHIYGNP